MMETTVDPRLLALAGMVGVWVVCAWLYGRAHAALPQAQGETRWFHLSSNLWWMGPPLIFLGAGGSLFLLWLVPIEEKEVVTAFLLITFFGGIAPVMGVLLMRTRFRADDAGLVGYTAWGSATFMPWQAVQRIRFSSAMQSLSFEDGLRPLYVAVQLHEWPAFVAEIERRLPHLALPAELQPGGRMRNDGERIAFEGHWQGMYDHAGRVLWIAALVVAGGLLYLEPHPPALALAALGGAGMAMYPLLRRLIPKPRKYAATIGNLLQFAGVMGFYLLTMAAYRLYTNVLGGEDAMTDMQFLAVLAQTLGLGILSGFALILLAKWRWPERFARDRMDGNGWDET
jgi:hypothetical protein